MISVVISMYGKASILFVDPKVRMNGVHYCTLVLKMFIPQMSRLCPNFILEQDGTRCYIPAYALPYIGPHVPQLLEPEFWSPPGPDLNPLNYCLDCDTQSSERRRLRPIKNEDRQIMEDNFLENYRQSNSHISKTFANVQ